MALPTTATWSLADFNATNLATLLELPSDDLAISPGRDPYFVYTAASRTVHVRSSDDAEASLTLRASIPSRFTFECLVRCPSLPHNLGDLDARRVGFTVADDAGRGFSLYFAKSGVAISRIDDFGSVTALPDTGDVTESVTASFYTVRVAIDGALGRAYVFVGQGVTDAPPLRWLIPAEKTPDGATDTFRVFAKGTIAEPVHIELRSLRLAGELVVSAYPPTAIAGPDRAAPIGSAVRFDGRSSYDVEGAPLAYKWQCIEAPFGSDFVASVSAVNTAAEGDANETTLFLIVPPPSMPGWLGPGDLVRVHNRLYEIAFIDTVTGRVEVIGELPEGLVNVPAHFVRQSILIDPRAPTPTAVPDVPGLYRFRLLVSDGELWSEPSEVLANITATPLAAGIEPDVSLIWKAIGDEWRFVDGARVFEEAWIGVTQVLGAKLLETWQHHYNTSARDAQQIFQRKWIAYRTMIVEGAPEEVVLEPRHGAFLGTFPFHQRNAEVRGLTLGLEILEANGAFRRVPVVLGGGGLTAIVTAINNAVGLDDIKAEPVALREGTTIIADAQLSIWGTRPFRLFGAACGALGLAEGSFNLLGGSHGGRITDRTYYVGGIDLLRHGVRSGDLLVLHHGESFRIDRVLSDSADPGPNQRVLLSDVLPLDADASWTIPGVFRSAGTDYEAQAAYPGDLLKAEVYVPSSSTPATTAIAWVVGQREKQLAVELSAELHAAFLAGHEVRVLGVKRRRAIPIPPDIRSIPTLQEVIAQKLEPDRYQEHIDYVLEPFYRGVGGAPQPMLQFRSHVFADPAAEPADVLWAETTMFDNAKNIEDLFGRLVNFLRDDAADLPPDFNYVSGVFGLLYAQQRGPTPFAMSVGAQILLGQPFAEVAGTILEIRPEYSPRRGRMLITDDQGRIRAYYYRKSDTDLTASSGLGINPETSAPWQVGERVSQFSGLGGGVSIDDVYSKPTWWRSYMGAGIMYEVEKFHRFAVQFDTGLVALANLSLLHAFITRVKPRYTRFLLAGAHSVADDIDVVDDIAPTVALLPYDAMHVKLGYRHDDYMGDGRTSHRWDDTVSRYDGLVDNVLDLIELCATIDWPGGALNLPHPHVPFQLGTPVVDINGTQTGTAGQSFALTQGMQLAAGRYRTCIGAKTGPILPII